MIRVVIAEDNLLVREGVATLLGGADGIELLEACVDADQLRAAIVRHEPHVVVTDIRMPPRESDEGIQVARELRRDRPQVGVVVLSSRDEPQHALALLEGGAAGRSYLLKERVAEPGQLAQAIREVARGGSVIDPKMVGSLIDARARPHASAVSRLTPRELDVLSEMAKGKTNAVIAEDLSVTVRGVERHINAVFAKLGLTDEPDVHHRVRAVLLYLSERDTGSASS